MTTTQSSNPVPSGMPACRDRSRPVLATLDALAVLTALAMLAGCGGKDGEAPRMQGYVEGEYLRISAPEAGWVVTRPAKAGAMVAAGDLLFTLEDRREQAALAEAEARLAQAMAQWADLRSGRRPAELAQIEARLRQARAALALAEAELRRQGDLARGDATSRQRLDQSRTAAVEARAQVAATEAELESARLAARTDQISAAEAAVRAAEAARDQARWRLDQRGIRAPRAARVEETIREAGEWAPAGGPVVTLLPAESRKIVLYVGEPVRNALPPGTLLTVGCTGCPDGLQARITWVATTAEFTPPILYSVENRHRLVFRAEAAPLGAAATLSPGQPVDVRIANVTGRGAP